MTTPDKWREIARRLGPRADELHDIANRLQEKFEAGDMLAPFECCSMWAKDGLDSATLPVWVADHFLRIAADYYNRGPRRKGRRVLPRRLIEMTRAERESVLPSLDRTAGLVGDRGRPGVWLSHAEHGRDDYVQAYLDQLMEERDQGERVSLKADEGRVIPVFTEQGRSKGQFRSEALDEIARWFRVKGRDGKSRARTMRRRFRTETDK